MTTHTYGPFTWTKDEENNRECWDLERLPGLSQTHFSVKNYGGEPGDGFRGWKLVSAGPFNSAGSYKTFEEALVGITPYLVGYYTQHVAEQMRTAQRAQEALLDLRNNVQSLLR